MGRADRRRRRPRIILGGVVLVLALVVVVALGGALMTWTGWQRSLIYFPDRSAPGPAGQVAPGGRDVVLHTEDGLELGAWLLPATTPGERRTAVLYAPGNGGSRAMRTTLHRALTDRGFTVLALDYRGYAGNPGTPSEDGLAADARAAVTFLRAEGFDADHTIYLGESLGTGVVARLSSTHPPAGMVLRSPFTALADVGAHHYPFLPVRTLMEDRYPTLEHVSAAVPTTIVYGEDDSVVPTELSRRVVAATADLREELALPGTDHNDPVMFGPRVADTVSRLADAVVP